MELLYRTKFEIQRKTFAWKVPVEDKFIFRVQSFQHNVGANTSSASSIQAA